MNLAIVCCMLLAYVDISACVLVLFLSVILSAFFFYVLNCILFYVCSLTHICMDQIFLNKRLECIGFHECKSAAYIVN